MFRSNVKFIEPLPGAAGEGRRKKRYYQFTAIDDYTRIRVLRIFERNTQKSAIQFIDYVLAKLPFQVEVVQTDNGSEFQGGFHWHLLDRGIGHVYIKPKTPRLNGKVERSHRIDAEEFYRMLEGVVIDDAADRQYRVNWWADVVLQQHRVLVQQGRPDSSHSLPGSRHVTSSQRELHSSWAGGRDAHGQPAT